MLEKDSYRKPGGPGYWRNTVIANLMVQDTEKGNYSKPDGPGYWRKEVVANLMVQDTGERKL